MDGVMLQRRCEAKVRELGTSVPCDPHAFLNALETRRGRPILLRPQPLPPGLYGLWVPMPSVDCIMYEQETSRLHQLHIILHEAGHMLWEHQATPKSAAQLPWRLFDDIPPDLVNMVLQQAGYSTEQEDEAEMVARVVLGRAAGELLWYARTTDSGPSGMLERLEASLED